MYLEKNILGIITARGGSKGLPRKNVLPFCGKPLIAWTIDACKNSKYLDRFITSTDDPEIAQVAESFGCEIPFVRPIHLASDTATSVDVILHVLEQIQEKYNYIVLLQPTSPLRTSADIDVGIKKCIDSYAPSCISICESQFKPHLICEKIESQQLKFLFSDGLTTRRQDIKKFYSINGAVYAIDVELFLKNKKIIYDTTVSFEMSQENSVDIDDMNDFELAEFFMKKYLKL